MRINIIIALLCIIQSASAQTSDSLIVHTLRSEKIQFSDNNSVALLMSGQEKFDDMFKAIQPRQRAVFI